jgi:hypothetical protein
MIGAICLIDDQTHEGPEHFQMAVRIHIQVQIRMGITELETGTMPMGDAKIGLKPVWRIDTTLLGHIGT